ncbi:hypothetical protein AN1V17_41310 [Vallitalea sediminicola]
MKKLRKSFAILCMSLVLCLVSINYNFQVAYANPAPIKQQQPEQPSIWALEDVQMLSIYDIIDISMFGQYQSNVTYRELYTVGIKLYEKLADEMVSEEDITIDDIALQKAAYKLFNVFLLDDNMNVVVTRKDVVDVLYRVIKKAEPTFDYELDYSLSFDDISSIDGNLNSVKYLVSNKLLNGIGNNKLGLENNCTKEQLFSLTTRAYYYAIQKSDRAAKGAFWKVSGGKNTVYLLGSIHIADSSIYPMNDDILEAFDSSDALAVEVNLLDSQEGIAYMQQKMVYSDGTTIDQHISEETYQAYEEAMKSFGVATKEQYDLLKPWSAAFTIQNLQAAEQSIQAGLGVDVYFMSKAMFRKPIIEIEGYKFQTDLFESFDPEFQELFLQSVLIKPAENDEDTDETDPAIDSIDNNVDVIAGMLESWRKGNVGELEKVVSYDENATDEFTKKFWIDRNDHMYESVLSYLNDDSEKTYFVIVGAGHMVTNAGIVKKLEDKGYSVEQIK